MTARHLERPQRGAALMLLLMLISVGALAVFVTGLNRATVQFERDRVTAAALAQAKEALMGRAASDNNRPGSLPCPADQNDEVKDTCSSGFQGYFPWKTHKLAPLLDGNGEALRYELSAAFRDNAASEPLNHVTTHGNLGGAAVAARIFTASGKSISIPDNALFPLARKRVAGAVRLYLAHPFPDIVPLSSLAWFNNNWAAVVTYTKISDDDANLVFTGCPALIFNYHWNALNSNAEMAWTGQC
jgi:hypothetical protein